MHPSSEREIQIYHVAVPILKSTIKFCHFTLQLGRDGKEMYKKAGCKYRVVVLLKKPFCVLDVPVAIANVVS